MDREHKAIIFVILLFVKREEGIKHGNEIQSLEILPKI